MQTKILVLRKNRLLIGLALFAAAALLVFFLLKRNGAPASGISGNGRASVDEYYRTEATYRAGVYTCGISLNDTVLSLEIVLDKDHINSMRLINLEDSVATMYPLMEPALNALAEQLTGGVAPEDIVLSDETKYTQLLLMEVINQTLAKAALE
ncbi:MAG: hypothetical protein K2P87_14075 [Lachnospiraceae bacterium]|nr:hypothetical protein [Lachnospiraceae bacterium]